MSLKGNKVDINEKWLSGSTPPQRPPSAFSAGKHCDMASAMIFLMHSIPFYQDNIPNKWTRIQPGQDKCPYKSSRPIHWCFIQWINGMGAIERVEKCQSLSQLLRQRRWREDGWCWCMTDAAAAGPCQAGEAMRLLSHPPQYGSARVRLDSGETRQVFNLRWRSIKVGIEWSSYSHTEQLWTAAARSLKLPPSSATVRDHRRFSYLSFKT